MSKHISRKERWTRQSPGRYVSSLGPVFHEKNGWYAQLDYRTLALSSSVSELPVWIAHQQRLGPFRRPRNAMVALEREVTILQNRHGKDLLLGDQLWAET